MGYEGRGGSVGRMGLSLTVMRKAFGVRSRLRVDSHAKFGMFIRH